MKNILITGITGFVGSNLARELLKDGYNVNIVGTSSRSFRLQEDPHLGELYYANNVFLEQCDMEDGYKLECIMNKYNIDTVFHLAAVSTVKSASECPIRTFNVNIKGTWNLLDAARRLGTVNAIVGMSSDKAYGDSTTLPYKEYHRLNALNTYDASKACEDILLRTYANNYDMNIAVARPCNIYGGDRNISRLFPNTICRAIRGESPIIYGGVGEYMREFIYIDDVVRALIFIADGLHTRTEDFAGEAFNVGTLEILKVEDAINKVIDYSENDLEIEYVDKDKRFKEISNQYLDSSKLQRLGWTPLVSFDKGIKKTYDWYLENIDLLF